MASSGRTTVSPDEFDERLTDILSRDKWIIDGNYLRTLPLRLRQCNTVFLFDLPVDECLDGAMQRLGKDRVDMPWTDDQLDDEFRQWILDFPTAQMPVIELLLENFNGEIVRFYSREESDCFIANL